MFLPGTPRTPLTHRALITRRVMGLECFISHKHSGLHHVLTPFSPLQTLSCQQPLLACAPCHLPTRDPTSGLHDGSSQAWHGFSQAQNKQRFPLSFTNITGKAPKPVPIHHKTVQLIKSLKRAIFTTSIIKPNNSL